MTKPFQFLILLSFLFYIFSLVFTTSIDLNQDLGRHLKLGEITLTTKTIPKTNLFSFTNPSFPFVNHHWLAENIFYLLSLINLKLLFYLKVILIVFSFFILLIFSVKRVGLITALFSALLLSPLLLERPEIRPEIFGYLFFSLMLIILLSYPKNKRLIYLIPFLLFFWVNIHISFVFGVFLTFLLLFKIYRLNRKARELLIVFFSLFALLLNPNFINGALYPLYIFQNYGYSIVENQNLFFLKSVTFNPLIRYYFFISPIIIVSLVFLISRKKVLEFILLLTFFLLTLWQIRHLPFFILAALPTISSSLKLLFQQAIKLKIVKQTLTSLEIKNIVMIFLFVFIISLSFLSINNSYYQTFDINKRFGLEFSEDAKNGVDFLLKNQLSVNIFNNFDIGGYLIYKLYPNYKFFVDNRPEAYPADFLQDIYIKLQTDPAIRDQVFQQYKIKTIFFSHTDQTPWAKEFLKTIYREEKWKIVYLDNSVIILSQDTKMKDLRNNLDYFQKIIDNENNYIKLLTLSQLFNSFKLPELANAAFLKAKSLNSNSCAIQKALFNSKQNISYPWYCF